ncbi:hypothetical protein [Saccharopolyspora sp. NPDC050642]|uniref:hypothetical protein n=1 Tax=Saccharopolyspora sp. NPDC050642 TaxID=3157099 RepID=UPI0033CD4FA9
MKLLSSGSRSVPSSSWGQLRGSVLGGRPDLAAAPREVVGGAVQLEGEVRQASGEQEPHHAMPHERRIRGLAGLRIPVPPGLEAPPQRALIAEAERRHPEGGEQGERGEDHHGAAFLRGGCSAPPFVLVDRASVGTRPALARFPLLGGPGRGQERESRSSRSRPGPADVDRAARWSIRRVSFS